MWENVWKCEEIVEKCAESVGKVENVEKCMKIWKNWKNGKKWKMDRISRRRPRVILGMRISRSGIRKRIWKMMSVKKSDEKEANGG